MGLQVRVPLGDGTSRTVNTSPAHDISMHWPYVLGTAVVQIARGQIDKPLIEFLDRFGQKPIALMPTMLSYIRAMQHMISVSSENPLQSLIQCGFYDFPPQMQMAVQYLVGVVATGFWFASVKEVGDEGLQQRLDALQELALKYMRENAELKQTLPDYKSVEVN